MRALQILSRTRRANPSNGREGRKARRKVQQKKYRLGMGQPGVGVRVKWCGKSAPRQE